jgi:hypothetical protein
MLATLLFHAPTPNSASAAASYDGRMRLRSVTLEPDLTCLLGHFSLSFPVIATQLEFLAWRDTQLAAISLQLEEALPTLLDDLTEQVERASIVNLVCSTIALRSSAEATIQRWSADELATALIRAEAELDQAFLQIPGRVNLDSDVWEQMTKALPAIAGVGLIGASLAAIPTVISFATVSTSVLAFWGTSAISWPLFALGAVGLGVATLTGSQSLKFAKDKARGKLCRRLHRDTGRQVFGIGEKPGARCILSDIQAAVVQAGRNRTQGAAL